MQHILIVGAGTIGSFMGVSFRQRGFAVTHLLRPRSSRAVDLELRFHDRRRGAHLPRGSRYRLKTTTRIADVPGYDFIVVPVGHAQLRNAVTSVAAASNADQTIVISGNVWGDFDWLKTLPRQVIYAFPNFGGAIQDGKLHGWLTRHFTTGVAGSRHGDALSRFEGVLAQAGFEPTHQPKIEAWLRTHFGYNAATQLAGATEGGFAALSRSPKKLRAMYELLQEVMHTLNHLGVETELFPEGQMATQDPRWNALKAFCMLRLPGVAAGADMNFDVDEWSSYARCIVSDAHQHGLQTPLLDDYLQRI